MSYIYTPKKPPGHCKGLTAGVEVTGFLAALLVGMRSTNYEQYQKRLRVDVSAVLWCTRNLDKFQICMMLKKPKSQFKRSLSLKLK